jgi:hypothetical protein
MFQHSSALENKKKHLKIQPKRLEYSHKIHNNFLKAKCRKFSSSKPPHHHKLTQNGSANQIKNPIFHKKESQLNKNQT